VPIPLQIARAPRVKLVIIQDKNSRAAAAGSGLRSLLGSPWDVLCELRDSFAFSAVKFFSVRMRFASGPPLGATI
jgi:hypothetical protein